jgi:hypothetical protein
MPHDDNDSKVFDISRPYKTTPSASSRPVIVGHHPVMPDPMVLEERYRHPEPLKDHTTRVERPQAPESKIPNNTFPQTSPDAPNDVSAPVAPVSSTTNGAYTTYGTPTQPAEETPPVLPQTPQTPPAPIFDAVSSSSQMSASTTPSLAQNNPSMPDIVPQAVSSTVTEQPLPEDPLHVPAGAASREHGRNQILLAVVLLIVIIIMAFLAFHFLT